MHGLIEHTLLAAPGERWVEQAVVRTSREQSRYVLEHEFSWLKIFIAKMGEESEEMNCILQCSVDFCSCFYTLSYKRDYRSVAAGFSVRVGQRETCVLIIPWLLISSSLHIA